MAGPNLPERDSWRPVVPLKRNSACASLARKRNTHNQGAVGGSQRNEGVGHSLIEVVLNVAGCSYLLGQQSKVLIAILDGIDVAS